MKFVFYANTDWYLFNFRLSTAMELKSHGHEVVMLSPPGDFGARFAALGFRWIALQMDRASLNPLREAATLRRLVRVLKEEKPDVLHNFTVKCAVYGALAARAARVPAVVNAVAGMGYVFTSDRAHARALASTRAPAACASCTANVPTPPPAPRMSTVCPAVSRP